MKYIILFLFFHFINVNAQSTLSFHSKKGNDFEYINVDSISLGEKGTDGYIPSVYASGYCLPISLANIDSITFSETPECRNWYDIMNFPSRETIDNYNNSSTKRSPYIYSWLTTNVVSNFSQYSIDFKADYLPPATYCSLANFYLDYSSLLEQYSEITVNDDQKSGNIYGYAGFQRQYRNKDKYNGILSLWQIYCKKSNGGTDTIRARLIYPEGEHENYFSHEGCGVNYLPDYNWKSKNWYRMLLQLGKSSETGNTTLEYWVLDLNNKKWTKLCVYDLGAPNVTFIGQTAVFLENFSPKHSGEIRTLEFKNVRIFNRQEQKWMPIKSGYFGQQSNLPGSYQFGSDESAFYMITSGVSNCTTIPGNQIIQVSEGESDRPY